MDLSNYKYDSSSKVWTREKNFAFGYSEGDETENELLRKIESITDRRVLSPEMLKIQDDWPSLYHFSSLRANLLRPFFSRIQKSKILELGCGLGALTRYLGEAGAEVVHSVEGSYKRASIAASRCSDLTNVQVINDTFDNLVVEQGSYDIVTLIGVLEYAAVFSPHTDPFLRLLEKAFSCLKDNGILILAIENKLGLKYFAGVPEDHLGQSFIGIEDGYSNKSVRTFSNAELISLLEGTGFMDIYQFIASPDYKLPSSVILPNGLTDKDFRLSPLLSSRTDSYEDKPLFNVASTWGSVEKAKLVKELSDSLCFVASKCKQSPDNIFPSDTLAFYYGSIPGEHVELAKELKFVKEKGKIVVKRSYLGGNEPLPDGRKIGALGHYLEDELYVKGVPEIESIRKSFLKVSWELNEITQSFVPWFNWLKEQAKNGVLPPQYIDALPSNLLRGENGEFHYVDKEWVSNRPLSLNFVVLRGLYVTLERLGVVANPHQDDLIRYENLIQELYCKLFGIARNEDTKKNLESLWEKDNLIDSELFLGGKPSSCPFYGKKLLVLPSRSREWYELRKKVGLDKVKMRELESEVAQLKASISKSAILIQQTEQRISLLTGLIDEKDKKIEEVFSSKSWKITRPLRFIKKMFKPLKF